MPVGGVVAVAVGALHRRLEALQGADGGLPHGAGVAAEVERHDHPAVVGEARRRAALDEVLAGGVGAGGRGAHGDVGDQAGVLGLDDLQGVDHPLTDRRVPELGVLDVDVEGFEPVGVDDLLVGARQRARAGTLLAELVAAPPADRDHHIAAGRPDRLDRGLVGAPGERPAAVPLRVAPAVGEDEGQREPLDAGRLHHVRRLLRAAPAEVLVRRGGHPGRGRCGGLRGRDGGVRRGGGDRGQQEGGRTEGGGQQRCGEADSDGLAHANSLSSIRRTGLTAAQGEVEDHPRRTTTARGGCLTESGSRAAGSMDLVRKVSE